MLMPTGGVGRPDWLPDWRLGGVYWLFIRASTSITRSGSVLITTEAKQGHGGIQREREAEAGMRMSVNTLAR